MFHLPFTSPTSPECDCHPFPKHIVTMRASLICSATLFPLASFAFPANLLSGDISEDALAEITALAAKIHRDTEVKRDFSNVKRAFNADAQRVSTTGKHAYVRTLMHFHNLSHHYKIADCSFHRLRQGLVTFVDLALD
jgi:hypothetical protein